MSEEKKVTEDTKKNAETSQAEKKEVKATSEKTDKTQNTERRSFGSRNNDRNSRSGRFNRNDRNNNRRGGRNDRNNRKPGGKGRGNRRGKPEVNDDLETKIIEVRRVTRVVRGGKRMRFAALVVVGDKKGKVGFGFKKGMDFQDSVAKATKKAKENLFSISLTDHGSIDFPIQIKNKSSQIFLKPAPEGTGLIAGGYLRSVLELAGVQNIFSKILGSNNKILGVQTSMKALQLFSNKTSKK